MTKSYYIYNKVYVLLLMLLVMAAVGCHRPVEQDMDDAERKQLAQIEDSVGAKSPSARRMIERALKSAPDSLTYYEYYVRLGKIYYLSATPDSMHPYLEATIRYANRQPSSSRRNALLAYAYNCQAANYHNFHKNPDEVILLYHKADSLLGHSRLQEQRPMVCANLGDAYLFKNQLVEAASWYRRALFLVDSLKLPRQDNVTLYMGLATIYQQLNDFKTSLRYYQQTEAYFGTMSVGMQAYFLNNYGNYYYYAKDYKKSLAKFLRLKKLLEENHMQDNFDMYLCKVNMADLYLNLGNLDLSERYLDEVEPFVTRNGDAVVTYYCNTIRIGLAVKRGNMRQVQRILASEQKIDKDNIAFPMRQVRNNYLRRYYEVKGDYRSAFLNLSKDMLQNDSLEHNRTNMRASEIMERFTQDTLQLHHSLAIERKNADIQRAHVTTTAAVALALVVVLLFALWMVRARKRNLQNQMRIMQLRLASARNRISPHFVFNVLNNKIVHSDRQEANELLELTKLIRANLDMSCQLDVSLGEELDFVRRYVKVEHPLVGDDFDFSVYVADDVDIDRVRIPSMMVQILVENALVHGLRGWDGHKRLAIDIRRQGKAICIAVNDNGPGFDIRSVGPKKRTGLNIISQTMAIVNERNKSKMNFSLHNRKDAEGKTCGCEAILLLPENIKLLQ